MALSFPTTMLTLKPYVYLDETPNAFAVEVYVKGPQNYAYTINYTAVPHNSNTYLIKLILSGNTQGNPVSKISLPQHSLPGLQSGHTKIIVLVMQGNNIIGRTTVTRNAAGFDSNDYKLFTYLQFQQTGSLKYHGYVEMGSDELNDMILYNGQVQTRNAPLLELSVNAVPGPGAQHTAPENLHFTFNIGAAENYDPSTYDTLEMRVNGSTPKTTKGSTTDSEADASGDN